jgi:hypothetical protein
MTIRTLVRVPSSSGHTGRMIRFLDDLQLVSMVADIVGLYAAPAQNAVVPCVDGALRRPKVFGLSDMFWVNMQTTKWCLSCP